jgi:hypothetical protein
MADRASKQNETQYQGAFLQIDSSTEAEASLSAPKSHAQKKHANMPQFYAIVLISAHVST